MFLERVRGSKTCATRTEANGIFSFGREEIPFALHTYEMFVHLSPLLLSYFLVRTKRQHRMWNGRTQFQCLPHFSSVSV